MDESVEITPEVKTDWNNFQTHLNGDYPTTGALNEFNGKNPNSSLLESHIPAALNYIQSIKANQDIPGLTQAYRNGNNMKFPVYANGTHPDIEEMGYNKWRGLLPTNLQNDSDYDLKALYKENPNVQPSENMHFSDKYKKPNHITFSDESMYNGQGGAKGGHWGKQGNQDTFEATDQNIKNAGGIQQLQDYFKKKEPNVKLILPNSGTSSQIPAPDYNDPKSRNQYAQQFTKKYGIQGRGDTPLRINETMDEATDTAKNLTIKAAKPLGIDPALLYSSAMEEGMSGLFKDKNGYSDFSGNMKYPTGGFRSFGLDDFADQAPGLVKKGYLSKDFASQYVMRPHTNEQGRVVHSADFKSPDAALQAKAAVVKDFQDQTEAYAQKKGIPLSDKAKQFFTLVAYNGGAGTMQKMLAEYKQRGLLEGDKYLTEKPVNPQLKAAHEHTTIRLKMADALRKEGLF